MGTTATVRPRCCLDAGVLPRLLPAQLDRVTTLAEHLERFGALPSIDSLALLDAVDHAGLTGRGGAAFPVARKLQAVRSQGPVPIAVGNAAEGEPAASKDKTLLALSPHLIVDGLTLAARAVGASHGVLYLHSNRRLLEGVGRALAHRREAGIADIKIEVVSAPARFIAGEESAVVGGIDHGMAIPRVKPPRVFESGIQGRPTLVQNVETLAHLALIARYGPEWFRTVGTDSEPGSMLFSVSGAVQAPRVIEAAIGVPLSQLWTSAGGLSEPIQAVLLGGYHGSWLTERDAEQVPMCNAAIRPLGSALGAGVVLALPRNVCGLVESARVLDYLAGESAGQCGPCLHGMPRLAAAFATIARPRRWRTRQPDFDEIIEYVTRRSACNHPDGSVRFAQSTLRVFASEMASHSRGICTATSRRTVLPTPSLRSG